MHWLCRNFHLPLDGRPLVMGIVNVTPDSFSDGGRHFDADAAIAHGLRLAAEGADILDVGGESTRPGAEPVPVEEELRRVVPVVLSLARQTGLPVSIDTMKAPVAAAALEAGAAILNDVAAFRHDPHLYRLARASGAGVVLMHMRGEPRTMQEEPHYDDVVAEVGDFLAGRASAALQEGLARETIVLDPGIGFGKDLEHNLALLRHLPALIGRAGGFPLLVGLSRKRFLGSLTGRASGDRLAASLAGAVCAFARGARVLRVHDVKETCDALKIAHRILSDDAL